jgi:hypothetical protein
MCNIKTGAPGLCARCVAELSARESTALVKLEPGIGAQVLRFARLTPFLVAVDYPLTQADILCLRNCVGAKGAYVSLVAASALLAVSCMCIYF